MTFAVCWGRGVPKKQTKGMRLNELCTGWMGWMAHRKWKESKQQPSMLPDPAVPGCFLISFHFLWAIHPIRPVLVTTTYNSNSALTEYVHFCNHFRSVIERNGENSHEDVTIRPIKSSTKCATSSSENEETSEFEIILVFLFVQ